MSPSDQVELGGRHLSFMRRAGAAISAAVPFALALGHAAPTSIWRDDAVVLQGLGWVGSGRTGCVSALIAQVGFFLPLGSVHFRLSLMAAVVLGAAGFSLHAFTRDLLAKTNAPWLTDALATIAALTATSSATGQREGAVAGGSGMALLLAVTIFRTNPAEALRHPPRAAYLGMLGGALLAESFWTAVALVAGIAAGLLVAGQRPTPRAAWSALGGAFWSAALLLSPAWVRPFASAPFLDIGRAMGAVHAASPTTRPMGGGVFDRLTSDGLILLASGAAGLGLGFVDRRLRGAVLSLAVVIALYAASVLAEGRLFLAAEMAPLHLVVTAALAVAAAIAVHAVATALLGWQLPMAKGAVILLVMTDLTLAVAAAEEASFANDRSSFGGADAFTDEALEQLPPAAALLVRSRPAAYRLWAAQLAHGVRPDVLVVPVPGTGDARLALRLLRAEPALQKALRDISLEGRPGEEALTILADARPVLVELDPAWDRRVLSHMIPDRLWLRFAPEPRGPSDRKAAFAALEARAARVLAAGSTDEKPDSHTAAMVRARLVDGAVVAALLGDRDEAMTLAGRIGGVPGGELFSAELTQKLLATKSGPVDARSLLR
jgi:hypothetical protein